ncbi:MAG TPA: trigger factor [Terriglobales bacterium]|nr:trigger factor [Terriglobales bacterium]
MTIEATATETDNGQQSNPCQRELTIEVPAEVVTAETENLVNRYQKLARIPGFRKGKVPASLVRQRFAENINSDVVDALVPRYFQAEAKKQNLSPISPPRVTDVHIHQGEPLRFKASFEILPAFQLAPYEDLRVSTIDTNVTDEEVETALNNLRQQHATYTAVEDDRPLADGDFAVVSFKGTAKEGEAASPDSPEAGTKPVEVDEIMVEVGGENTIAEFSENLRGARAGEQRTFEVKYENDFSDQRLAGKTMTYELKVKGIKTRSVPELTDDFAKELGADLNTLAELRARLRSNMKSEKEHEAERQGKDQLVAELVKRNDFPVPQVMVNEQIDTRLERGLRALAAQGMSTEDMKRMDFARLRASQREAALREVKAALILEQIADREKIDISDEEVERELQALAMRAKQPVEQLRARLTQDGGLDRIRHRLRNEKTLDALYRRSAEGVNSQKAGPQANI